VLSADLPDPDRIFAEFRLAGRGAVVAAVSGGSDSLALLLLLKGFLDAWAASPRLVAVTVDHGLRSESAGEAEIVAATCRGLGIGHRIMRWSGDKPSSGLPAAAREARYRLLAEAAQSEGTDIVLTGHTLDDQLETVAMRRARGSGRGLAGMATATLFGGRTWILRPLLGTRRSALRHYLAARGIGWIDDPTNIDRKYERARLRATLGAGPGAVDEEAANAGLRSEIAAAASRRIELGEAAAGLVAAHARQPAPGLVRLDSAFADAGSPDAAVYALRILLAVVGGVEQLPDRSRVAALYGKLGGAAFRTTLSRTAVDSRRAGIFLHRERRGLPGPTPARNGMVWDGRYRIDTSGLDGLMVAPFGIDNTRTTELPASDAPDSLVRAALACEPAPFPEKSGETGTGLARAIGAVPLLAPWARFLPSFDLAPARAVAALIGAETPPEPPFAGHNMRKA
jgi:tRNA(Ile)-lysidine synthase